MQANLGQSQLSFLSVICACVDNTNNFVQEAIRGGAEVAIIPGTCAMPEEKCVRSSEGAN